MYSLFDFKPFAIANFTFKIITKILLDMFGGITSRILFLEQSGFVYGTHIHTPIGLESKCDNMLDV